MPSLSNDYFPVSNIIYRCIGKAEYVYNISWEKVWKCTADSDKEHEEKGHVILKWAYL